MERSREKGGWKDGRGGCGKDEEADPTYLHYLQHPQPRCSPQHHRSNLILIFSQLGHHIHHLSTSTSDMNLFYRVSLIRAPEE